MSLNRAIIPIQELNCHNCAIELVNILSKIKHVSQLGIDYKSSEVYFNFQNVVGLADVENMLTELGFNPVGENVKQKKESNLFCKNASQNLCVDMFS